MLSRWPILLAVLSVGATSSAAQTAEDQIRAEPKLQAVFSRKFDALPISDLLAAIAKETGVNIAAGNRVANDMVILVAREKSYAEVLLKLAAHFGFTWQVQTAGTGKQYLLTQSSESVAAEAKLRSQQELARIEPLRKAIAKEAALTEHDLATYRTKLLEWYRQEPKVDWQKLHESRNPDEPWRETPEEKAYREWQGKEEGEFGQFLQPDRRAVVQFISTLGDREWMQLASGTPLSFCTTPRTTQGRLPGSWVANTREWLRMSQEPNSSGGPNEESDQDAIPAEQRLHWDTMPRFSPSTEGGPEEMVAHQNVAIVSITLYMPAGGSSYFGVSGRSGMVQAKLIAMDARRTPLYYSEYGFGAESRYARRNREGDDEAGDTLKTEKDYSHDPVLGKPVKVPQMFRGLDSLDEGEQAESMMNVLQGFRKQGLFSVLVTPVRHAIAESAGVCLISDAYIGTSAMEFEAPFGPMARGEQQVGRLLDTLKASGSIEWKFEDGWITLRTSDWAYWRPRQIPPAVYARLQNVGYGAEMSFDELVQIASSLTEEQFEGSGPWTLTGFLAQSRTAASLADASSRSVLRMWGGLSAAQRNALVSGGRIPLQVMTPAARDAIHTLVKRYSETGGMRLFQEWDFEPEPLGTPLPQPGEAAPPEPYDWTEYIPDKTPMPVAVSLERKTTNGFYMAATMGAGGETVYRMEMPEAQFAAMMSGMEDSLEEMGRFGVGARFGRVVFEDYHFRVHLAPEVVIAVRVGVSHEVPNSSFDPKDPPPDVRRLIEKSKAERERMMREYEDEEP
ncbi:MAG: hypothetical protein HRF45_07680 [Fimbriimonadia bacterium]